MKKDCKFATQKSCIILVRIKSQNEKKRGVEERKRKKKVELRVTSEKSKGIE